MEEYMFNDQVMQLFCSTMVLLMSNDKPLGSSLFMSMALSLKASALFYIPVFLGLI